MRWPCFPHVLIHLQFSSVFPLVLWQWWVLHSQENPRSPTNSSWHQAYEATSNSFCKNFNQDAAAALLAIQALSAFTHPAASAPEASSDSNRGANGANPFENILSYLALGISLVISCQSSSYFYRFLMFGCPSWPKRGTSSSCFSDALTWNWIQTHQVSLTKH